MSFAARIVKSAKHVVDLRVVLNGEPRHFIIALHPAKAAAFTRAVEKDEGFTIEDYGTILHRGWDEPDEELKAKLHAQFGLYA